MRLIARVGLTTLLFVVTDAASARPVFTIPNVNPESIKEVDETMRGDDEKTSIPAYLEGAQCGGWDKNIGVSAYIANVWGLPGRYHDWAGDIRSGMGTRLDGNGNDDPDDDYDFPDSTRGLSTAC